MTDKKIEIRKNIAMNYMILKVSLISSEMAEFMKYLM